MKLRAARKTKVSDTFYITATLQILQGIKDSDKTVIELLFTFKKFRIMYQLYNMSMMAQN